MDEQLRRLERTATTPQEIHQLSRARIRAGRCAAHGSPNCKIEDCQFVLDIYYALQNPNFIERYTIIDQMLYQRAQNILFLDYENLALEDGDDYLPASIYFDLSMTAFFGDYSILQLFGIFIKPVFACDVIDHYQLDKAPYMGSVELRYFVRNTLWDTNSGHGWKTLIYTAYGDDEEIGLSSLRNWIEVEAIKRITLQHQPLEIEKVLKALPGRVYIAADLIEKARSMLFIGERWEAMGEESHHSDDWHWLRSEKQDRSSLTQRWKSIEDWKAANEAEGDYADFEKHYVFIYGYPNLITVKLFPFPGEELMVISQQLDQDTVEIKMNIAYGYAESALPRIHKLQKEGHSIVINSPPFESDFEYYDFIQEEL